MNVCLNSMKTQNTPTNTKTCIKAYASAFGDLVSLLPDCGVLIVNHMMVVMAIIGVLPLWYHNNCHRLNSTDAIKYLKYKFSLPKTTDSGYRLANSFSQAIYNCQKKKLQ